MTSICGLDCCGECARKEECGGCAETGGKPFGGRCVAAECVKAGGLQALQNAKETLIAEFNALGIKGLQISDLNLMNGFYVNLEYPLPGGRTVRFLEDNNVYWANQIEIPGSDRCCGIVADENYLLVCEYGCGGADPRVVLYKRR